MSPCWSTMTLSSCSTWPPGNRLTWAGCRAPAVLRVATGVYQCPALQGRARPAYRSGSHYRNRLGVVSFSQDLAEETQRVIPGGRRSILLPLRPTGYAPAERNSILLTFNVPRWARLNRRSGPNQLAKSTTIVGCN